MPPRNQHSVVVLHLANFAWYKAIQVEEFQVILNFVHLSINIDQFFLSELFSVKKHTALTI